MWVPISLHSSVPSTAIVPQKTETTPERIPSPHSQNITPKDMVIGSTSFRFQNFFTTPISLRHSPLPILQWADSREVWQLMLKKEELYIRDSQMLDRHKSLQPRMRSILLDWLIEVSGNRLTFTCNWTSFFLCSKMYDITTFGYMLPWQYHLKMFEFFLCKIAPIIVCQSFSSGGSWILTECTSLQIFFKTSCTQFLMQKL